MQDVSYNLLADMFCRLVPDQLQAAGAQGRGPEAGRGLRQLGPLADGEAGTGLVGACTVLCNALINGLILWGDTGDGESPAEGDREQLFSVDEDDDDDVLEETQKHRRRDQCLNSDHVEEGFRLSWIRLRRSEEDIRKTCENMKYRITESV